MDLPGIYSTFHPNSAEHPFFSAAHGTVSKIEHTKTQIKLQRWLTN